MWKMLLEGIWLSVMSISDIHSRRIPLWMIGLGIPLVVLLTAQDWNGGNLKGADIVLSLMPGILLLLLSITRNVGYGDGLVMLLLGLMEGKRNVISIFSLSFILMSVCVLVVFVLHRAGKGTKIPYLPFLLAAWFGERIFL